MSSITENALRIGNFTSSEIVKLTGFGKDRKSPSVSFDTYIEECNSERRLGRSLDSEVDGKPLSWGKLCERYVCDNPNLLGLEYESNLSETTVHPLYNFWSGSEDLKTEIVVSDIKAPKTLKSLCGLVDSVYVHGLDGIEAINWIRANHKDGDKYYWQGVSNACIHGKQSAELIIFCPYQSELQALRDLAQNWPGEDPHKYQWIYYSNDSELPYLIDGGFYKNKTVIRFEVPQVDKDFLTQRVIEAGKKLITVT